MHPSEVAKSSTSFGWGKGGKVTSAGWQVTLCDPIWHVISRSGVVMSITNCYIRVYFTLLYFILNWALANLSNTLNLKSLSPAIAEILKENSALHPSMWQVTLCDPLWHVISRIGIVIWITKCYIRVYFCTLTYWGATVAQGYAHLFPSGI